MNLAPLQLYRALLPFKEKADASLFFKRICDELINERINILKTFNLLTFFGGEANIKKDLNIKLNPQKATPIDIETENSFNELINSSLTEFVRAFKTNSFDFRPLIGFLIGKSFSKPTFSSLQKELQSLARIKVAPEVSKNIEQNPVYLLTMSIKPLEHYYEIRELKNLVDNQLVSGVEYLAVVKGSYPNRRGLVSKVLLPTYGYLTQDQINVIFDEANRAYLLKEKEIRNASNRNGIIAMLVSSILYFFVFFFLSLLATHWGYSQFGKTLTGQFADMADYKTAFLGMIFILPTFFLATYFGSFERRLLPLSSEHGPFFQLAPRFIPPATLILHAVLLFTNTKNLPSDAQNIFQRVFYLGDKGYTLALIYIFIAITVLIMDIFSCSGFDGYLSWNEEGKPGRSFLTQNGAFYIIPFIFFLRLYMPAIPFAVMIALTILTFIFGFMAPTFVFVSTLIDNSSSDLEQMSLNPFVMIRGWLATAIFVVLMIFTYLMMTYVHPSPDLFKGSTFLENLGWFVFLAATFAGLMLGLAQLSLIELDADDDNYLDISPTFYFFIVGFILLFFIIPSGNEKTPNIYHLETWKTVAISIFIIALMIVSIFHDVTCLISGGYEVDIEGSGFVSTRVSNVSFILCVVILYLFTQQMHPAAIYILAIGAPIAVGGCYVYNFSENDGPIGFSF